MNELNIDYTRKGRQSPKIKRILMIITRGFAGALLIPAILNFLLGINFILQSVEHKILFPKKYFHISDKGKTVHIYSGEQVTKKNRLHFPSADEMRIKASIKAFSEAKHL